MAAISTLGPLTLWTIDYITPWIVGNGTHYLFIAAYMADPKVPLPVRIISTFHVWLPFLAMWLVWRLGYHRRAWIAQSAYAALIFTISYLISVREGDKSMPVNVNWVFGLEPMKPHKHLNDVQFVAAVIVLFVIAIYLPTHLLLRYTIGRHKPLPAQSDEKSTASPMRAGENHKDS